MSAVAGTKVTTNLFGERWSKLAINCMANPLAGLTGLGTLQVRTDPQIAAVGVHVGAEAIMVGRAVGHEVEPIYGIPIKRYVDAYNGTGLGSCSTDIADIARKRGGGEPSLLQDVMKKRRTEIDYLNGYVCEQGKPRGASRRRTTTRWSRRSAALGVGFKPDREHLDPVIRMLPRAGK